MPRAGVVARATRVWSVALCAILFLCRQSAGGAMLRRGAGGAKRWLVIGRRKYRIHEMLGLPPSAPREHVRTAYLEALLREHPDHNIEDPQASTSRLIALNDAWQCYRQAHRDDDAVDSEGFTAFGVGCSFSDGPEERT